MKVQVNGGELLRALSHVQSIVEKRNTQAILSNVKISTKKNQLSFYTTDLEIFAKEVIDASVGGELTTTTPIHILYDIAKKIADDDKVQLIFEPSDKPVKMLVKSGLSEFTLPCLSSEEFPDFEQGQHDCEFNISCEDVHYLFSTTKHAISFDDTKYYLNGVFLHIAEENDVRVLRGVATDVHRLAIAEVTLPKNAALLPEIIIPRKTALELLRLLEEHKGGQCSMGISSNKMSVVIGNTTIVSKLIDAKFPDYNKAIPYNNPKSLEISIDELSRGINLVTAISTEKIKAVKLKMQKNKVTLFVTDKINSSGIIEIPAVYDDEEISISFNSRYILDILEVLAGKKIHLKLDSGTTAVYIEDSGNSNCRFVLMPMQV